MNSTSRRVFQPIYLMVGWFTFQSFAKLDAPVHQLNNEENLPFVHIKPHAQDGYCVACSGYLHNKRFFSMKPLQGNTDAISSLSLNSQDLKAKPPVL